MHILYYITYTPHINTELPKYYIGSKYNWNPDRFYMGSVASKKIEVYTEGMELKNWWKYKTKTNTVNFNFQIIATYYDISTSELLKQERNLQIELDVVNSLEYFNSSLAGEKFVSQSKSIKTKLLMSEKAKQYWQSPKGLEKRKRLSNRNRLHKSKELLEKWKSPSEAMLNRQHYGRPLGSLNKNKYSRFEKIIIANDIQYENAKAASGVYKIRPTTIRLYCRENRIVNGIMWRYA